MRRQKAAAEKSLLLAEGLAVGTLVHGGVSLVSTNQDPLQGTVVGIIAMVSTLMNGALDALVCMAAHIHYISTIFPSFTYESFTSSRNNYDTTYSNFSQKGKSTAGLRNEKTQT